MLLVSMQTGAEVVLNLSSIRFHSCLSADWHIWLVMLNEAICAQDLLLSSVQKDL